MAKLSGKDGTVIATGNEITPISNWKLNLTSANDAFAANDTAGWKTRVAGVKDSSGSFDFELDDTESVPFDAGDTVTLLLDVDGTDANFYTVPVIIDEVAVDVDINDGTRITIPVTFSGTGAVSYDGIVAKAAGGSGS